MSSDRSWRADPSVKWAMSRKGGGKQPWDILLVNCPSAPCGAQNYFLDGSTIGCRRCGIFIGDRADEVYSVGVAMELELEELRQHAIGGVEEVMLQPFDPDKSSTSMPPVKPEQEPPPASDQPTKFIAFIWILFCIGLLAAMAVLSRYIDGNL